MANGEIKTQVKNAVMKEYENDEKNKISGTLI